jgi:hypothetical protein
MVVISTAICNKNAKLLFARQFEPITRLELEEHVVHFSRNIDSCKDSTHLEFDRYRYLFIPVEELFLVLITTKQSNVIEDIEILKLIYRLLQDQCGAITPDNIRNKALSLTLGIDDIVSLGVRESINISQIKQLIEMESQDEKEFKKEQEKRELAQKKQMDLRAKEFDKLRRENKYVSDAVSSKQFDTSVISKAEVEEPEIISSPVAKRDKAPSKGLQLGKKKKEEDELY